MLCCVGWWFCGGGIDMQLGWVWLDRDTIGLSADPTMFLRCRGHDTPRQELPCTVCAA